MLTQLGFFLRNHQNEVCQGRPCYTEESECKERKGGEKEGKAFRGREIVEVRSLTESRKEHFSGVRALSSGTLGTRKCRETYDKPLTFSPHFTPSVPQLVVDVCCVSLQTFTKYF